MFTYDLTCEVGRVRLLIADTDPDVADFDDSEVDAALSIYSTLAENARQFRAAAMLLNALAANRARLAASYRRGGVSEDLSKVAAELREQATVLGGQAAEIEAGPLEAIISPSFDRFSRARNAALDRVDSVFKAP